MRDAAWPRRVGEIVHAAGGRCMRPWLWAIVLVVLLLSHSLRHRDASAAQRTRPIRLGALTASWGPTPQVVGLRDGLLELGYRESEQFVLGVRFTQGDTAGLPAAARELVQGGVDMLIADSDESAQALQRATAQIPMVFIAVSDPVRLGLVQSFAHPGGSITGVADLGVDLGPKRLQIFREIVPTLQRVLYLYDANDADAHAAGEIYRHAARRLGIELIEKAVQTEEEAHALLAQVRKEDVGGILAPPSLSLNIAGAILEASTRRAIPTMFSAHGTFFVEEGGLAS